MTERYLIDTNVVLYARGGDHPQRGPCRQVLRAAATGAIRPEASVEMVQEFAHVLLRRPGPRSRALEEVAEVTALCHLHPFDLDVLFTMRELLGGHAELGVRGAVHAATALHVGPIPIVSTDQAFDHVDGVTRLDPTGPDAPWAETIQRPTTDELVEGVRALEDVEVSESGADAVRAERDAR